MIQILIEWANTLSANQLTACVALVFLTLCFMRLATNIGVLALLAWPGTVSHELAHAIVGLVLGAKPVDIRLFPKSMGNGRWLLGSVSFTNLKWWNTPWTAMAPIALAPLAFWMATGWVTTDWEAGRHASALWKLYLGSVILHASWPSRVDFAAAFPGFLILGIGYALIVNLINF